MSKIVNYGFIFNSSLESVELSCFDYFFTPHIDYCKRYMRNDATEKEKEAFKAFCVKNHADEFCLQIYVDFCTTVLNWVMVGNAYEREVLNLNFSQSWHSEVVDMYQGYLIKRLPQIRIEELLNGEKVKLFQNGIIFPEYVKSPKSEPMRFLFLPQIYTVFNSESLEEMEAFAKEYCQNLKDTGVQHALMGYEVTTPKAPTFYLDFCIGAFNWCRIETSEDKKLFYDAGVALWNFSIFDLYKEDGYSLKKVTEIKYLGKKGNMSF